PVDAPALGADQLSCVRVLLLRHDGGAGRKRVRQADEAELRCRPDDDLLGEPGKMCAANGGDGKEFQREIAVRNRIDGVPRWLPEAKSLCRHLPVNWEARACQRRRTQGAFVKPL